MTNDKKVRAHKKCNWDLLTITWVDGKRAHPCKKCDKLLVFGGVRVAAKNNFEEAPEWSGHPDPNDPDNYWIDDRTGERIRAGDL